MAKKYIHKALSVGLSLALCAGLVAPALAASFNDLQQAIRHTGESQTYGADSDGNGGITAWTSTDEAGKTVINVQLNDTVQRESGEGTIAFNRENNVILDLNGHTVKGSNEDGTAAGKGGAIFNVTRGNLTIQDNSDEKTGTITGGNNASNGGGIVVTGQNTSLTLEGGTITGNTAGGSGGGVSVNKGATFTMNGGEISGNIANGGGTSGGAGVHVRDQGSKFTLNNGKVHADSSTVGAKGNSVAVHTNGQFEMNGGELKGNVTVEEQGGGTGAAINGGNVSQLDPKYLEGKGLIDNGDGTYRVVEHSSHTWGSWSAWTDNGDGTQTHTRTCLVEGCTEEDSVTEDIPTTSTTTPTTPTAPTVDDPAVIDIDEPAVPLAAGPVSVGEFLDYLWRHEGEPEAAAPDFTDVPADHEYAPAIGWAQSIGILDRVVVDNALNPDELVTVAAVRDILTDFAQYADMEMPALATLTGEDDEAVLNCDEILAEFFGEELAA